MMKLLQTILATLMVYNVAQGRPNARASGAETVSQTSRVTSFSITDEGVVVECWEVGDLLPDTVVEGKGGSTAMAHRLNMFNDDGGLAGVDILTWPSYGTIYPPSALAATDPHSNANFDFTGFSSSFTLLKGLIVIERLSLFSTDDEPVYYFGPDNGDDWFYFEDSTTSSDLDAPARQRLDSAFKVSTVSGGETSLIQFKHKKRPQHKVLHKGACHFAGLVDDSQGKSARRGQSGEAQSFFEL